MTKEQKQMAHVGSMAAVVVGILYVVVAVTHMLIPMAQRAAVGDGHGFYQSFSQDPTFSLIEWWALGILSLFAIAVVLAVHERFVSLHAGWVRWASGLALLGYGVTAILEFTSLGRHPVFAAAYAAGDPSTQAAIAAQSGLPVDGYGVLRFGAVAFWALVISVLILRSQTMPRLFGYLGLGSALAMLILVAGFILGEEMLIVAGAAVGGVLFAPAWFIWLGLLLRREGEPAMSARPAVSVG